MPHRTIHVAAPSRLHFGMFAFGDASSRQFGGAGAMIDRPGLRLTISPSAQLEVHGLLSDRALDFVRRWILARCMTEEPRCRVQIVAAPRQHVGLGVGTQLGLSVAAGLNAYFDRRSESPPELAQSVGRAKRSAVGTYGFAHGGLLAECGRLATEAVSPLDLRVDLPGKWRFVLICPRGREGLSGEAERRAFRELPPVPETMKDQLVREIHVRLMPAAADAKFDDFSESLYRYGHAAGMCFADQQNGPFAGPRLTELVQVIRRMGVRGVGQSSWGPTLFALLPGESEASMFVDQLAGNTSTGDLELVITTPNNTGARVQVEG